ncbi:hypothetical protein [Qipengyuania gaetbuli]|uniref:hypothetical protein n=1 Tax=Qipengyuania gaetbuli TaxID=266952 RepID=UPI001CD1C1B7|nr:hypothetical protein [Qipengyuania gaetbuli]MCA0909324.1 hypothetical protein [Qipengyuania gaetbuli]
MVKHFSRELVAEQARIVDTPVKHHEVDRTFELPRGLYVATVGLYLGFIAVMAAGLPSSGLAIPMVIFAFFIVAAFGVPTIWTRLSPETRSKALSFGQLKTKGIMTHTGRLPARDAAVQVLILPAIVFTWGLVAVTVASLVR